MKTNNIFKNLERSGDYFLFSQMGCIAVSDFMNVFKIVTEALAFLISALSHPEVLRECVKIACFKWCTFCELPGKEAK